MNDELQTLSDSSFIVHHSSFRRPLPAPARRRRRPVMAEAKSRREPIAAIKPRPRGKGDLPPDAADGTPEADGTPREESVAPEAPAAPPRREPERPYTPTPSAEDYAGFDEEINNRYEETKRG